MEEGFEHLRCPMCGGELIYSEGTHDMCCSRNPYESMSSEEWEAAAALRERRGEYGAGGTEGGDGRPHIYKVWNEGERGNLRLALRAAAEQGHKSPDSADAMQDAGSMMQDDTEECEVRHRTEGASAGGADDTPASAVPIQGRAEGSAVYADAGELSAGEENKALHSAAPVKGHKCVFAVSFTESSRFGTLWSVRIAHGETNYFALMRLMQKIEKRRAAGEPLAANSPHPPKKRERTRAGRIAFHFGLEEEDVYSIKYSTETVRRLALFYGIPERDVRRIQAEDVEEE
ncbi:MAG: hypothetical protein AB1598_06015 [Thermodesulfobacteriota bacterium]